VGLKGWRKAETKKRENRGREGGHRLTCQVFRRAPSLMLRNDGGLLGVLATGRVDVLEEDDVIDSALGAGGREVQTNKRLRRTTHGCLVTGMPPRQHGKALLASTGSSSLKE
jgi:hypothetical protein